MVKAEPVPFKGTSCEGLVARVGNEYKDLLKHYDLVTKQYYTCALNNNNLIKDIEEYNARIAK